MPSAEFFPLRTPESYLEAVTPDDLLLVRFLYKICRFVSANSYKSWSFIQLTLCALYTLLTAFLFLQDFLGGAGGASQTHSNEQLGRLVNAATAVCLGYCISSAYLSTHRKREALLRGNWLATSDPNVITYFKQWEVKFKRLTGLIAVIVFLMGASLLIEHFMSVRCYFCYNAVAGKQNKLVAIAAVVATFAFSLSLLVSVFLSVVDLFVLNLVNKTFANSLYNQLSSVKPNEATTLEYLNKKSEVYRPLLQNGININSALLNALFAAYPCVVFHIFQSLLPPAYKTSATLSQLLFPLACVVVLVLVVRQSSPFRAWRADYHALLTRSLSKDKHALEEAISTFNYIKEYTLGFVKKFRINFIVEAVMTLSLMSLLICALLTGVQLVLKHRLL